jgi:hypothetical protein
MDVTFQAYITLSAPTMEVDIALPFTKFEPESTVIPFAIKVTKKKKKKKKKKNHKS